MITDVTVIEPDAYVVWDHVHGGHLGRGNGDDVGSVALIEHRIAVPMGCMEIIRVAQSCHVPSNTLAFVHRHHRHAAEHEAVDRIS